MAPNHHPSAQALADFLIGDCSPGQALLMSKHLAGCVRCASRVQAMGALSTVPAGLTCSEPRPLGPGLELTVVEGASGLGEAVYRLKAEPGVALLLEPPFAFGEILVLEGGLTASEASFSVGDYLTFDAPKGPLVSDARFGVVCLVAAHETGGSSHD